jgi:type I restriction enzyme R subunit
LSTKDIIEELIAIAKELRKGDTRKEELGLTTDELAFYDALATNGSAVEVMGDKQLSVIARDLVKKVKANASIDWTIRESAQAKLRVIVKRTLKQFGYPPDLTVAATKTVLEQAELFGEEWSRNEKL